MDAIYFTENLLKFVRNRTDVLKEQITEGSVPDFITYQRLRSQYEAWVGVEQEVRSLLKRIGMDDE